jgi:hypothetical protein
MINHGFLLIHLTEKTFSAPSKKYLKWVINNYKNYKLFKLFMRSNKFINNLIEERK